MRQLLAICILLVSSAVGSAVEDAAILAARGEFGAAANAYLVEADGHSRGHRPTEAAIAWSNAATCLKMTGDVSAATLHLKRAESVMPADCPEELRIELLALKGSVGALGKRPWDALGVLQEAERRSRAANLAATHADVLNDLGIVHGAMGNHQQAADFFAQAENAARLCGEQALAPRARQNHVIAAFQFWQASESEFSQEEELKTVDERAFDAMAANSGELTQPSREQLARAADLLRSSLAAARSTFAAEAPSFLSVHLAITAGIASHRHGWKRDAFNSLTWAVQSSQTLKDQHLEAESLIALAEMYFDDQRPADALSCLEHARSLHHQADAVQTARLELLTARCHASLAPVDPATSVAVLRAVSAVERVRSDIARTQAISDLGRSFRERAGKPYLMLADLALRLAATDPGHAKQLAQAARDSVSAFKSWEISDHEDEAGALLARNAIEAFKAWELQDFYRDDCVNVALAKERSLDKLGNSSTAILYAIPFDDRVEILLGQGGGLYRATSAVKGKDMLAHARRLRARIQWNDGVFSFLDDAEALHDILIRPIAGILAEKRIRHIVFVPDGALATIPLGVLRDKRTNRFLLEDYSVSVAPGLAMVPSDKSAVSEPVALLAGFTQGCPGFPPLPAARVELDSLVPLYPNHRSLIDQSFSKSAFAELLKSSDSDVIHLATHGEFLGRADQTFLLCGNGRITLDELEKMIHPKQFRGKPVDLLCLSACKTAAGDDRAALGLAGAAVKSGSRTVLATLWQVDDTATSAVMTDFHTRLRNAGTTSKAEILRQAQLKLLHRIEPCEHPSLWAPFVLVGDWQ